MGRGQNVASRIVIFGTHQVLKLEIEPRCQELYLVTLVAKNALSLLVICAGT